jgi:hypothetical protein
MNDLQVRRLISWRQTPDTGIPDTAAAAEFINRVGVATLYPVSPEVPNLYHGYVRDREARTDSHWDSPSGHVYTWRWEMGKANAAFYSVLVKKRPTFVSWDLLPSVLRLRGELRTPDELADLAVISPAAYRIAEALENAGGFLSTSELRQAAGFPTGKEERAAYLKAVEELDSRLMLAKVFINDADAMGHALVATAYPEQVEEAERATREGALDRLLRAYLPNAVYALPTVLARHTGIPEEELRAGLERLVAEGDARPEEIAGQKGRSYVWAKE